MLVRGGAASELETQLLGTVPIHLSDLFLQPGWAYKTRELRRKFRSLRQDGEPSGWPRVLPAAAAAAGWLRGRARSAAQAKAGALPHQRDRPDGKRFPMHLEH
jgi:hypothetical protein